MRMESLDDLFPGNMVDRVAINVYGQARGLSP